MFIVEHEGGDVGRDDGRVEDEDQDKPVPDSLKRRVVKDRKMMHVERLHLVFRQHFGAERQHLKPQTGSSRLVFLKFVRIRWTFLFRFLHFTK